MAGSDTRSSYSQTLRVIGQLLEVVKATEFDLQLRGDTVALQYKAVETVQAPPPKPRFGFLTSPAPAPKTKRIESSREYSSDQIAAADRDAQRQRVEPDGNADFYSLPQT